MLTTALKISKFPISKSRKSGTGQGLKKEELCSTILLALHNSLPILNVLASKLVGVAGIEPTKCQSQSLVPYRLATPQFLMIFLVELRTNATESKSGALPLGEGALFYKKSERCRSLLGGVDSGTRTLTRIANNR